MAIFTTRHNIITTLLKDENRRPIICSGSIFKSINFVEECDIKRNKEEGGKCRDNSYLRDMRK
jgi:hypothetical protein